MNSTTRCSASWDWGKRFRKNRISSVRRPMRVTSSRKGAGWLPSFEISPASRIEKYPTSGCRSTSNKSRPGPRHCPNHDRHERHRGRKNVYRKYPGFPALPDQLRQALANLLTNAVQAMKGRGRLSLTTGLSAHVATVSISDRAPVSPSSTCRKSSTPFSPQGDKGRDQALDLRSPRRILRKFGGDVRIESLEGQGRTCSVTLPILVSTPEEAPWTASASRSEPQSRHLS